MTAGILNHIITLIYDEVLSDTPVYVSEVNSNKMQKVVGVQIKKSFVDNGDEKTWVEIIYAKEERELQEEMENESQF